MRSKSNAVLWNLLSMKHPRRFSPRATRLVLLLRACARVRKEQFYVDGWSNLWIVKAPDVSRGLGMSVLHQVLFAAPSCYTPFESPLTNE